MAVQEAARNISSDGVGAAITELSLHFTDGGATGTDELAGGSYTREVPSYVTAAAGGVDDLAASVIFGGPAAATNATHLGFRAGATWLGSVALAVAKNGFVDPDTLTVSSAPIVTS